MSDVISVNPFRCRMWRGHERLEEYVNEETCREEIDSFQRHGQRVPVLGRPIKSDGTHDFELIYGCRRLFVACHLNVHLLIEVRDLTDQEAAIALDIENRQRKTVSPYERGVTYALWLREGVFPSQDQLARTLRVSASQVSRLLKLARLPSVLVSAFQSPLEICETWGTRLMDLWEDGEKRLRLAAAARAIVKEGRPLPGNAVFARLMSAATKEIGLAPAASIEHRIEVVRDDQGEPLFRIRRRGDYIAFLIPRGVTRLCALSVIRSQFADILHRARLQKTDLPGEKAVRVSGGAIGN